LLFVLFQFPLEPFTTQGVHTSIWKEVKISDGNYKRT